MSNGNNGADERYRLELLQARAEIADVIHRYARNVRSGDYADCESLFTEDAVFETREGKLGKLSAAVTQSRLVGRPAILDYLARSASSGGGVCPMIHNILIDVDGNQATSSCVMEAFVPASGASLLGEYRDTFRNDGEWRFTSRTYTIFHNSAAAANSR